MLQELLLCWCWLLIVVVVGGGGGCVNATTVMSTTTRTKTTTPTQPDLGPISWFPKRGMQFEWSASLSDDDDDKNDNNTKRSKRRRSKRKKRRRANSIETSTLVWKINYESHPQSFQSVYRVTQKLVEMYSQQFLVKLSVSGGLLKASVDDATTGTTSLKLRFLPFVTLLSFQRPKVVSYTKGSWWRPKQQHQCTFELPIDGGLLSLSSNHDDDDDDEDDDRGCLMFQAIMEKESKSAAPLSIKRRRRRRRNRMVDEEQEQEQEQEEQRIQQPENPRAICKLRSELQNYSPWIAGTNSSSPIPKLFQKWMYLYSQSLVHGYVMWRFHRTWQDRIQKVC